MSLPKPKEPKVVWQAMKFAKSIGRHALDHAAPDTIGCIGGSPGLIRRISGNRHGAISVVTALCLVMLLGFVGLAVDLGRMFVVRNELQSAVDACALAAAMELNGQNDAPLRAQLTGQFLAAQNLSNFQSVATILTADKITFSSAVNGPFVAAGSISGASARFVRCAENQSGIATYFLSAVGISKLPLQAQAVAGVQPSQSVCSIPMALCASANPSAATGNFGYAVGDRATLGSTGNNGFFTWANVLGSTTETGLDPYVAAFSSSGSCGALTINGRCIGIKTGVITALDDAWNSRFGLYKSGGSALTPITAAPDLTGYGYRGTEIPAGGAYSNYVGQRVPNRDPYQSRLAGYGDPGNVNRTYGASFRRLLVMPVVDCASGACGNAARPIVGWACVLMLSPKSSNENAEVEFISRADDPAAPCRASGIAGGTNATGPLVATLLQ